MAKDTDVRFRCVVCGKLTAGRMPRDSSGVRGDTSARFPRRHKGSDGKPCLGNAHEAEWVEVDSKGRVIPD